MSTVITTTVLPRDGTNTLNIGAAGDTVAIGGDSLNLNVLQDAGGNNIFTSSSGTVSSTLLVGGMKLLSTQNASDSASISFTTGIDSTYDIYIFKFINLNPATSQAEFEFQANVVGASGYNETITSTFFRAIHDEANATAILGYYAPWDQAQGTAFQILSGDNGNGADASAVGELYLFAPSSTTYVKPFYSRFQSNAYGDWSCDYFAGGYFNTTLAIDDIQFKMSSGNFDGTIKLYGMSKS